MTDLEIFSVFGIPIWIDDPNNEEDIIHDLMSPDDEDRQMISDEDLKQYLKYAAAQHVAMEPIAEEMLNKYFKATRAIQPSKFLSIILNL